MAYWLEILLSSIVVLIASTVQGTVGFGFALIAVPLLTFVLPVQVIIPIVVVYSLITNIMVVLQVRRHIHLSKIWVMIVFGIIGIPIGVYGLKNLSGDSLKVMIGILICITVWIMIKGYRVTFRRMKTAYGMTGFISGILNGGLSMSGPPIVLFLSNAGCDKDEFRGNLTVYATITNIITVTVYVYSGMLTKDITGTMASHIVALIMGSYLGIRLSTRIKEDSFRKLVLGLLVVIGFVTIMKALI